MKTVMEVPTEWTCEKAEMICTMEEATQVKSTGNEKLSMIQQQPKWKLHWKAGVAIKVKFVLGVSTRTKYEMKSVI